MAELAFSRAIFQAMRDTVFSLSLPLLMQLRRVNVAGSQYVCLEEGQPGPPTVITAERLHYYLHVCSWGFLQFPHLNILVKTPGHWFVQPQWKLNANSLK